MPQRWNVVECFQIVWRSGGGLQGRWSAQRPCALKLSRAGGTQQAVVADFGGPFGQDVLKKAVDKLGGGKVDAADLLGFVVTVSESDDSVVERFQAAIGDGDAENIAGEIVEHFVATAGVLGVNDPARFPDGGWNESE